jgi:hypothetical protein
MNTAEQPTFSILYGIGEGPLIGRRMRRELRHRGLTETDPSQADLIITHSAGIYLLPGKTRAKLLIHLNCTTYMGYPALFAAHSAKIRRDFRQRRAKHQLLRWFLALAANSFYLLNIPRGLKMRKGFRASRQVLAKLPAGQHVFINGFDDGLSDAQTLLADTVQRHTYITIPAIGHDDCWRQPEILAPTIQTLLAKATRR